MIHVVFLFRFRGARHGVSMQAKMKRVEERDKEYLKQIQEGKVKKKKKT